MLQKKKEHPQVKNNLHTRNKHRGRYDFAELIRSCSELAQFVRLNKYQDESIDFSNAEAVIMLNKALLKQYYEIDYWQIPQGYLCPPIPGRADYIHYIADLLGSCNNGEIPIGNYITCLDIGVGANCIYPIIGNKEYKWFFVGSDVDSIAIQSATEIVEKNICLNGNVELRLQPNVNDIFRGFIHANEYVDITICNPPFHASLEEAQLVNLRKLSNLSKKRITKQSLNFGGTSNELWCEGGEETFVQNMIFQSKQIATSCMWFTTLISKQSNLKSVYRALQQVNVVEFKTIPMSQGNKISRIVVWTFLNKAQQDTWIAEKWKK